MNEQYDEQGIQISPSQPPRDPTEGLPPWAMSALAQQMHYEPQGTMWPDPNAKAAPAPKSPGEPGYQWQIGALAEPFHAATQAVGEMAPSMLLPATRPFLAGQMAMDTEPAYADKVSAIKGAGKTMGEVLGIAKPAIIKRPSLITPPANVEATTFEEGDRVPRWLKQFVGQDPQRIAFPGIYKRPDVIAAEAAAKVAPEHPAMKELFGVTRDDLYEISKQGTRQGNVEPEIWQPSKGGGKINPYAEAIMNPKNAQRVLDVLGEAEKYPELVKGMDAWYVHDPMYWQMVRLVGPERAKAEYMKFNSHVTPFSAGSDVLTEINRGTGANMMVKRGEYPVFQKYAGVAEAKRGDDFPELLRDIKGHAFHSTAQAPPVARYAETGSHGYDKDTVKIPLYTMASGVPETGFQTRLPVPDAHFTRALGMPDVRKTKDFDTYMGGPEYRPVGPWFRENVARPLGIEAVPAQARMWGAFAPQTGVETAIGAPKLELYSQRIWERAKQLGIDPKLLRDQVLRGEQHSELKNGRGMGSLAALDNYA